ncbi:MAG: hypothetical protein IPM49_08655 [Flavobacteriales bacterium]|nr:hypothetical protein [Flavobacteriales bacterium]
MFGRYTEDVIAGWHSASLDGTVLLNTFVNWQLQRHCGLENIAQKVEPVQGLQLTLKPERRNTWTWPCHSADGGVGYRASVEL